MTNAATTANPLAPWHDMIASTTDAYVSIGLSATKSVLDFWSNTAGAVPAAKSEPVAMPSMVKPAAKSWYRAPYRSPFDPMFWLEPPAWTSPLLAPFSLATAPAMPVPQMGWLGWQAPMFNPFLSASAFLSPPAFAFGGQGPWFAAMSLWQAQFGAMETNMRLASQLNSGDPFAAYRTAGGHATAQIIDLTRAAMTRR